MSAKFSKNNSSKPIAVKVGNSTVKIYTVKNRDGILYTISFYETNGQRRRINFSDLKDAKAEAQRIATSIQNGELAVLKLANEDRSSYLYALEQLKPTGKNIQVAAAEYAEAMRLLSDKASIVEAAQFYAKHHPTAVVKKCIQEVAKEFIRLKTTDGMSPRYLADCSSRFSTLTESFHSNIDDISTIDLQNWLSTLNVSARTRNNYRAAIVALFNFAKQRGYLLKNQPTEADGLTKAKDTGSEIGIFRPDEFLFLLKNADESLIPYLVIGAFAGLRHAELSRLDWKEIRLDQGYVEVAKHKSKTSQRRLVPISPNLIAWLKPLVKTQGFIFEVKWLLTKASNLAKEIGIAWPHNGLRHSFASYRLAECKSAAQVALEMGNSPKMIFQHYRELVTEAEAKAWWNIYPHTYECRNKKTKKRTTRS